MAQEAAKAKISDVLIGDIEHLPLWVKQVLYIKLREDMTQYFGPDSFADMTPEETVAFFMPKLTSEGERFLLEVIDDMEHLLQAAQQKLTVLDLCLLHHWSLERCCQTMVEAIKNQWIQAPVSPKITGTLEYMANRIRLGKYLVMMGQLTQEQLDQALRTQQYIKEALEEHSGLANILINLGYITRKDTEGILLLKQEAAKPIQDSILLQKLS